MKQILFIFTFICVASKSFGQSEFSNKFKAIPPLNTDLKSKKVNPQTPQTPSITPPSVFANINILNTKPKPNNSFQMGTTNDFSMTTKNKFVNPGDKVAEKLNKTPLNEGTAYRRNQDLGGLTTKSTILKIVYRDFGEVDGDEIEVIQNEIPIIGKITMGGEYRSFDITLKKGSNDLSFLALNEGMYSPNTAEFQIFDEQGILIKASQWNLFSGYKATITILKE
ncbi:MAG: hypothetical protein PHC28_06995 [Flavobacterium sp.]|uniref:hypothetical protein n=1 Tax=Flavobacterium sp. TaxID=239 RepID=UPI002627B4F3|nr:hypothetical protein [Flavobacterium sp.]MDD5150217.1 hypothetical protein [Flavobacterium sp.]